MSMSETFSALEQKSDSNGEPLSRYRGFWFNSEWLQGLLFLQTHFQAKDSDIIIATTPKSGTTWLKALTFSVVNRQRYAAAESPLLNSNPHELVPFLEMLASTKGGKTDADPRIFSTHIPHQLIRNNVLNSNCKILYICRNPLDVFISRWHYFIENKLGIQQQQLPIDEAFQLFSEGISSFGPFWEHMLGYWHASLENPGKILFLKYEDLKNDIITSVKKIADFLGLSFSEEEERDGTIEEITRLCSFENLKNLEVNRNGEIQGTRSKLKNSSFFRKGEVGDWANHLSPPMVERFRKLMEEKFGESGLSFEMNTSD